MQPPGNAPGLFFKTFVASPSGGQVLSVGLMYLSMLNGLFAKALAATPCAVSLQVLGSGSGDARLTSFCSRQRYRAGICANQVYSKSSQQWSYYGNLQ